MFLISESEAFDGRGLKNYQNRMRGLLEDSESYQLYWAKISKQAGGAKTIFLSGDGVYHIVNPLTLQNPATGKYVLDEITVRPVSTGRDFLIDQVPQLANSVVLVGNPIFDMNRKEGSNAYRGNEVTPVEADETTRSGIARLPGTQKEIDLIEELAVSQQMKTQVLSESEATESKVKSLQSPGILHLATHGEFDQLTRVESYLKSKLILAGAADSEPFSMDDYARYEDGFLTAYEVTQLVLTDTRLVVLSACETGLGEIQNGEGVWGLQRAFQLAGAQSIMGSLWKISDEATVTFMETFYQTYFEQKDLYAAYFKAMQVTRNQYSHPYFWGAFTLSGIN
jgi:CHAT domain-containing protein